MSVYASTDLSIQKYDNRSNSIEDQAVSNSNQGKRAVEMNFLAYFANRQFLARIIDHGVADGCYVVIAARHQSTQMLRWTPRKSKPVIPAQRPRA
ncbi:hypothetical protein O9929_15150 [Vibrio lentus]|nr:hypothetical protein [Vibrio lentus]